MSINFSKNAPSNGADLVAGHMSQQKIQSKRGLLEASESSNISVGDAIQMWTVQGDNYNNSIHEAFTPGDWQYLVFENEEAIAASYISHNGVEDGVHATSYGTLVEGVLEGLRSAESTSGDSDDPFEPRLLIIPTIHFTGLWLFHTEHDSSKDLVIPIAPNALSQLEPYAPMSLEAFDEHMKSEFRSVINELNRKPGDSGGSGAAAPFGQTVTSQKGIPSILGVKDITSILNQTGGGAASDVQLNFKM